MRDSKIKVIKRGENKPHRRRAYWRSQEFDFENPAAVEQGTPVSSLEDRLNSTSSTDTDFLITRLSIPPTSLERETNSVLNGPKYGLIGAIVQTLDSYGVSFSASENVVFRRGGLDRFKRSLGSLDQGSLAFVYRGMHQAQIPKSVAKELNAWTAVYYFAGAYSRKITKDPSRKLTADKLSAQSTYKIVRDRVLEGIKFIEYKHDEQRDTRNLRHGTNIPHYKAPFRSLAYRQMPEPTIKIHGAQRLPL
jgi:hypothetical protein